MHSFLKKTSRRIVEHKQIIRNYHQAKKLHWAKEAKVKTHVDRALEHYDDFYESVYKNRWPSLRLALLCEPKYMAIPNTFTGEVDKISESLQGLGAVNLEKVWSTYNSQIEEKELEAQTKQRDLERMKTMDATLTKIARTKQAEEMEVLYQNAPKLKMTSEPMVSQNHAQGDDRLIKDIRDASQEYITESRLKGGDDFLMESEYYSFYTDQKTPTQTTHDGVAFTSRSNCTKLKFPVFLRPHAFEPGNPSNFPSAARNTSTGLREYICVNGASFAPVMALDLTPDVTLLDLCSGPGTKSLLSLMTHCPSLVTCNDVEFQRLVRVKKLMNEFMGSGEPVGVQFTRFSGANYPDAQYDRVLADVPCLQDRVSCTIPDNNIFKPSRTRERLQLIHLQKKILLNGLRCLKPDTGSSCVYSTCTLSPIENDGVIGAALSETDRRDICVDHIGLWNALRPFEQAGFFFMSRTKFGVLVEPNIISNFGPMYVSRLVIHKPKIVSEGETLVNQNNNSSNPETKSSP